MKATYHWYIGSPKDMTGAEREPQVVRLDADGTVYFFGMSDPVDISELKGGIGAAIPEPNA